VQPEQLEMTSSGQMTLSFDPPIDFPAYMLASSGEKKSDSRNLSHLNMKEWAERSDGVPDRIKDDVLTFMMTVEIAQQNNVSKGEQLSQ